MCYGTLRGVRDEDGNKEEVQGKQPIKGGQGWDGHGLISRARLAKPMRNLSGSGHSEFTEWTGAGRSGETTSSLLGQLRD